MILIQHASADPGAGSFRSGSHGWQIHADVLKRPHDAVVAKRLPGSFTGTGLDELLKARGVDTVVICGYMTQMCCDTTARQAFHMGYAVEFLSDATGTLAFANAAGSISAEELHRAVLVTQASYFSTVLSVGDWLTAMSSGKDA